MSGESGVTGESAWETKSEYSSRASLFCTMERYGCCAQASHNPGMYYFAYSPAYLSVVA